MRRVFFTICARNYLAFAAALRDSLRAAHPGADLDVWLIDAGPLPPQAAALRTRRVAEALTPAELQALRLRFALLELSTAVKPACFRAHFAAGAEQVIYLDPDIWIYRPLDEMLELLAEAQGVLTPHTLAPLPRDGLEPSDLNLLRSGVFNLGFLALNRDPDTDGLLEWWGGWLRTHCYADPATGTFTDQKWLNFAPLFWPRLAVLKDPTYNVAYWNLPLRRLQRADGGWRVEGRPLAFFHFSGFDPCRPQVLSRHQTRLGVFGETPLARLLGEYANRVLQRGHADLQAFPPVEPRFDDGAPYDAVARAVYQASLAAGRPFPRPLGRGRGSLRQWLDAPAAGEPAGGGARITNYFGALHRLRPDLQQAFPDPFGRDRVAYLDWIAAAGSEPGVDRRFVEATRDGDGNDSGSPGINVIAEAPADGCSDAAATLVRRLQDRGIEICTVAPDAARPEQAPHEVNLVAVDLVPEPSGTTGAALNPDLLHGRYNVGLLAGVPDALPEVWPESLGWLDELWTDSADAARLIAPLAPLPVVALPGPDVGEQVARRLRVLRRRPVLLPKAPMPGSHLTLTEHIPRTLTFRVARTGWRWLLRHLPDRFEPGLRRALSRARGPVGDR